MMLKKFLAINLFCITLTILITGCELFDKPETIPSFIHIDSIHLEKNPLINEGSLSRKIVDAWIYVDGNLIGAFELPCTVPVLKEGQCEVTVYAGIYMNGVRTTRVYYPFFTDWKKEITLYPDSIVKLQPVVQYSDDIKMPFHEDFELGGVLFEEGIKSVTSMQKTSDPNEIFEGNYSGKIVLNDTDSVYLGVTIMGYELPTAGGMVFLELNYRSDADIIIGIYAVKVSQILQHEVAGILPKKDWGKIYINLSPAVFRENDALHFKIFLGSYLPEGKHEATILLDNLKLIHF